MFSGSSGPRQTRTGTSDRPVSSCVKTPARKFTCGSAPSRASRPESVADSVKAAGLELSHEELQAIGGIAQTA